MLYANIIVRSPTRVEELTYTVPAHIIPYIKAGSLVKVPLRNKNVQGVVVSLAKKISPELKPRLRDIEMIDKESFGHSEAQIRVIRQLAHYYATSLGEVAMSALRLSQPITQAKLVLKPLRPVVFQGTWPKRLEFYLALLGEHRLKHRLVFIFANGSHARELAQKVRDSLMVDDNLLKRKNVPIFAQKVVIGTLSAIFFPLQAGDYLIIDQPQDLGLKQQHRPYMSAKRIGLVRAQEEGIQLILATTLVAIEDLPKIKDKSWRFFQRPQPDFNSTIFDQRGTRDELLPNLIEELSATQKALIFTSTKGLASILICSNCGEIIKCSECDRALSIGSNRQLVCRTCQINQKAPQDCPKCRKSEFRSLSWGSTKIVQELQRLFPQKIIREVTSDTQEIPNSAEIVVATEKIFSFSELRFDSVFLVNIDRYLVSLESDDIWRFLAIMMELCEISQKQYLQTFLPEHWLWRAVSGHLGEFYTHELRTRQRYHLPPFGAEITLIGVALKKERLLEEAESVSHKLRSLAWILSITDFQIKISPGENIFGDFKILVTKPLTFKQKQDLKGMLPPAWRLSLD